MTLRPCQWCGGEIPLAARRDAKFCSKAHRQAAHRFGKACRARARADSPMHFAYADPPYPGLAHRYYSEHRDYAGEVDHRALLERLAPFDGWALSTSMRALPMVHALTVELGLETRTAAWIRGARPTRTGWPLSSWEPVVFAGGRRVVDRDVDVDELVLDTLTAAPRARLTDAEHVTGAKPSLFAFWLFDLLGARPGDQLDDLFPGSGGIGRAWSIFTARGLDVSRRDPDDASQLELLAIA